MAVGTSLWKRLREHRAFEFVILLVVVLLTLFCKPDVSKLSAVIFGFVVGLTLELLRIKPSIAAQTEAQKELIRLTTSFLTTDRDLFTVMLHYYGRTLSAPELLEAWCDLCWIFHRTYDVTNYIKPAKIYNEPWATPSLAIQIAKRLARNASIQKIFLVDTVAELDDVKSTLDAQVAKGIDVHYCLHERLAESVALSMPAKELESTDFGIFDNRCVLVWHLDDERAIKGGRLLFDPREVEKYQSFFKRLLVEATPCK